MYRNGKTMREVAEHFRIHRATVAIHLRCRAVTEAGGTTRGPGQRAQAVIASARGLEAS